MLTQRLWSARNQFDCSLRRLLSFRILRSTPRPTPQDVQLAKEVGEFLRQFDWAQGNGASLRIVDIGCRTFFLAPEIEAIAEQHGWRPSIDGIEIDAHRRMGNLRTRREYGEMFAASVARGKFHAADFLEWERPFDLALCLHPFVTPRAVLAWGLPLKVLQPEKLAKHCTRLLAPGGSVILSAPSVEELETSVRLFENAGLVARRAAHWMPASTSVQQVPRFGVQLSLRA